MGGLFPPREGCARYGARELWLNHSKKRGMLVARMINLLLLAYRDDRGAGDTNVKLWAWGGTCLESYLSLSDQAKSANIEVTASALAPALSSISVKIYPFLQQLLQALDLPLACDHRRFAPTCDAKLELKR